MRDITDLVDYLSGLGSQLIPYGQLISNGWTPEEIDSARFLTAPKPVEEQDKKLFWIAGIAIPLVLAGIAYASDLPDSLQSWIDSNGTIGSPIAVLEGNVTYKNVTIIAGGSYNVTNVSAESDQTAGSNPAASTNSTLLQNVTVSEQNVTQNPINASSNVSIIYISNLTESQEILEKDPIIQIYTGENKTIYVVDNHQLGDSFRWLISRFTKEH